MHRRIAVAQLAGRPLEEATLALEDARAMIRGAADAGADLCVLPEGTYPAYVVGDRRSARDALGAGPDAHTAFADAARAAGLDLVVGLLVDEGSRLANCAVHFGPDGAERNRATKRFLWHFDNAWFVRGGPTPVVDGLGLVVCADGRLPEIADGLARRGARLLVNATAWVVDRPAPTGTNAQAEFLWRVRALEHGIPAVAASKCGSEAGVARFAGRSQIVAADGTVLAVASPTEPELLVADVEVPDEPRPPAPRHPPTRSPWAPPLRPGAIQVAVVTDEAVAARLADHACDLVVGPHGVLTDRLDLAPPVFHGQDLLTPGRARDAAFGGAEVIVWVASGAGTPFVEAVARTRALENRVFVACWRDAPDGGPFVVGPSGAILAAGDPGGPGAVQASCLRAEAAHKTVVPGTDLFAGAAAVLAETLDADPSPESGGPG